MQLSMRCIQLAIISTALTVPTPTGALSHLHPEGVVIVPVQEAPQTLAPFPPHNQLYQTTIKIPEPTQQGTAPGGSGVNVVARAAGISVGLFVGILAVSILVCTAVLVWKRNKRMELNKLENAEITREFQKKEDKLPLSQSEINGSHGDEEHPNNTTI